jgi:hypothetical protein
MSNGFEICLVWTAGNHSLFVHTSDVLSMHQSIKYGLMVHHLQMSLSHRVCYQWLGDQLFGVLSSAVSHLKSAVLFDLKIFLSEENINHKLW